MQEIHEDTDKESFEIIAIFLYLFHLLNLMKEFFKFTKAKFIISLVLIILTILSIIGERGYLCKAGIDCPQPWYFYLSKIIFAVTGLFIFLITSLPEISSFVRQLNWSNILFIISLVVNLFYIYFLACLIMYIYPKKKV